LKLYPDLIPHNFFHKGIWLNTPNFDWYYFIQRDRGFSVPKNDGFNKTLDPFIIPVVSHLHKSGIPTTPSCSGHFHNGTKYIKVYNGLIDNQKIINTQGVEMTDSETGQRYYYKNKNYKLPWKRDEFVDKVLDYQRKGVLGLYDPRSYFYDNLEVDNFETIKDQDITLYIGDFMNEKECKNSWKGFNQKIREII
jgi:hypothetical protein